MTSPTVDPLWVWDLGERSYQEAWDLQATLLQLRATGELHQDIVLFLEHPHVFTVGRRGGKEHIVEPVDPGGNLIPVFDVDRGGDITYHGPGQLVVYPILRLESFQNDVLRYLRFLETIVVVCLGTFGVQATTNPPFTGVWTAGRKIASIGVSVQRGVTKHGFALNIAPDLSFFERIIPCGLHWATMTSLEKELGCHVERAQVVESLCQTLAAQLSRTVEPFPEPWQNRISPSQTVRV